MTLYSTTYNRASTATQQVASTLDLPLAIREVTAADTALLAELLMSLSAQTRWQRYFTTRALTLEAAQREAARLTGPQAPTGATLIVVSGEPGQAQAVALAELVRSPSSPSTAEFALLVRDACQAQGVGKLLARRLIEIARRSGIACIYGSVLAENRAMLHLIRSLGVPHRVQHQAGDVQVALAVTPAPPPPRRRCR
jgi:RimJ/RimL family protein N-acetyltransferase